MFSSLKNFIPVRTKLGLVIGLSTCIISGILITYTATATRDYAIRTAEEKALSVAQEYAAEVKTDMEQALTATQILAQTLSGVKSEINPLAISRAGANAILQQVLSQNKAFYGAFTCWEANAFDGQDSTYVNADAAHDGSGRFIPYWFKEQNKIKVEKFEGYEQDKSFQEPKRTHLPIVLDPVNYVVDKENVVLISISAPVLNNQKFYGIVGIDISVHHLQALLHRDNEYGGAAKISILSPNGVMAATTLSDTLLGQNIRKTLPELAEQVAGIQPTVITRKLTNKELTIFAPIYLGDSSTPWQISISIPSDLILKEANALTFKMILISVLLIALAVIFMVYMIQRLMKPLDTMMRATEKVAAGELEYQEITTGNDEIGMMNQAFGALTRGLKETTAFANQIGQGNLEADFAARGDKDVLGKALLGMRAKLKETREADKRREWTTEGIARFSEILRRNNEELDLLSEEVITNLVKYLGANQGGMYILNEKEGTPQLDLTATYAWDRKRFKNHSLAIGEGLAGQAVLEKAPIYLTEVPDNYMYITSGLGLANPKAILIMPLQVNDEVVGIVELASFKEFLPHQISFVEKIAESVAATITSVQINQSTRKLLEEARQSTEQLRSAEEELHQNQEELQATQEEMQRTMQELRQENMKLQEQLATVATVKETA